MTAPVLDRTDYDVLNVVALKKMVAADVIAGDTGMAEPDVGSALQLTGLDLSRHEDRMRADFALRLLQGSGVDEPAVDGDATDLLGRSVRSV